jgi:two-component system invasion response regulator UvrY
MTRTRASRAIRVAFADDHLFVRAGLRRFIASYPCFEYAGEAASAEEALQLVQATDIDVLLLDLNMPDRSGLEILPQLIASAPHMKVVVVSATPAPVGAAPALRGGAWAYIEKPVNPQTLSERIRSAAAATSGVPQGEGCG